MDCEEKKLKQQRSSKKYYDNNREECIKRLKLFYASFPYIYCPCGGSYNSYDNFARIHFSSKRHEKWIQEEKWKEQRRIRKSILEN